MKASDFERFAHGDGQRFHVRQLGAYWQVYALGLEDMALCLDQDKAEMVRDALERQAMREEGSRRKRLDARRKKGA